MWADRCSGAAGGPASRLTGSLTGVCPLHSLPSKFTLHFLPAAPRVCSEGQRVAGTDPQGPPSERQPFLAAMVTNQRVTGPSHFQDVRLIEFDITGSGLR